MVTEVRWTLGEVEQGVCDLASDQLGIPRHKVSPDDRLIEDLHCDSLDLIELIMAIEDAFDLTLPDGPVGPAFDPIYKAVFTRKPFRLCDLAEVAYLRQGTGKPEGSRRQRMKSRQATAASALDSVPFTQLGGRWERRPAEKGWLWEPLDAGGSIRQYRRRSDGMRCLLLLSAEVEIGCESPEGLPDERPAHVVGLDSFLIDAEAVSTTAYCRFLNTVEEVSPRTLADWFVLDTKDDRDGHMLVRHDGREWVPVPGAERWPMVLVSWYGANAYSLWANGRDWSGYKDESPEAETFLPSEAQWEYAARGADPSGGGAADSSGEFNAGRHEPGATYSVETLPLSDVNAELGMSPFGLHHAVGNVWQWCRDWYDPSFYSTAEASGWNPVNRRPTGVRSERGGSWVGPAELCRSSFRRGRAPYARGRCLGFRCVGPIPPK